MREPGRNERCPCGSGRKWKQCCGRPRAAPASPWGVNDRERSLQRLERWTRSPTDAEVDAAWTAFWPPWLDENDAAHEPIFRDELNHVAFTFFRTVDHRGAGGMAPIDELLAAADSGLELRERLYLLTLRNARRRPYRVEATAARSASLTDLLTGERLPDVECPEAGLLTTGGMVIARVLSRAPAPPCLEMDWLILPPEFLDATIDELAPAWQARAPGVSDDDYLRTASALFQDAWCRLLALDQGIPVPDADDGDDAADDPDESDDDDEPPPTASEREQGA